MPHRGEVSVCTSRQDTTVAPFYVKNETFSGSSVGGFSLVNAGTTVSNVSSELQASNNTPALPSEEASFTIVNGKTYTFSTDYTNRTFVPGYTVSVLCEIKVSGTTVASQSMTALGTTYTFTYTATSSGTATIRYTFVMTGGPFPPPPPSVSFSIDNVKISFDSTTYSTSYTCSTSAASGYKYGFNGKEKDNEINVDGGDYDFGARIYDGRLGRWLACDPLQIKYPAVSSFNFCINNPICFIDPNGREIVLKQVIDGQVVIIAKINKDGLIFEAGFDENNSFYKDFKTSMDYLSKSAKGKEIFDNIIESKKPINIVEYNGLETQQFQPNETCKDKDGKSFQPNPNGSGEMIPLNPADVTEVDFTGGDIAWNPRGGLIDGQGNGHSASMVLMHELVHADNRIKNAFEAFKRQFIKIYNDARDNEEEMVAVNITNTVIKELEKNQMKTPLSLPQDGDVFDGHVTGKEYRADHSGEKVTTTRVTEIPKAKDKK